MMADLGNYAPAYGFQQHKGYGTAVHAHALRTYGPSQQHRRSFRPLADFLASGEWPEHEDAKMPG
jgi:ribonuclease HII